ncbi:hypothetical protein F6A08_09145 [Microbacterium algeriense]|uniref:Histidine kinase n=1 Tax=Microbacterium algeriense TaxID=2615184 RepID=A0ABQ6V8G7_9MICO|nr:hypothetical protein F6A08_09145 [Microbacterium algeriense]
MKTPKSRVFFCHRSPGDTVRAPGLALAAAAVLGLEALALLVFAIIELVGLGAGDAASLPTAVALIVLTLIGAAALVAFALGTRAGRSWARSGGVVFQVLAVALALAALTLQPVSWTFVLGVGLPALVGFVLLISSARREGERREAE